MIIAILAMQVLTLIALAVLAWRVVSTTNQSGTHAPAASEGGNVPSVQVRRKPCQVLKRDGGRWKHHGWVRADSAAWREAHDTPDFALRDERGELIEGVQ